MFFPATGSMIWVYFRGGELFPDLGRRLLRKVDCNIGLPARNAGTLDDEWHCLVSVGLGIVEVVCLVLLNIKRKWAKLIRDWKAALDRFTIHSKYYPF